MDPNEALRMLREVIGAHDAAEDETVDTAMDRFDRVADLFTGLDEWLSRGGFLPEAWAAAAEESLPDHLIAVPKDSCEAEHPTLHLQCWLSYGHDGEHMVGDGERWAS